ncbi:MAG: ABC transporter ATP-binding protein [Actinobacteria bacterium]|nr:ABC transporter ATP-binding protein [Actinomycetota bacterium]NIS30731.1 ABC transporter ATP-binding protein [Actinomycetota bacterium]NIT95252.1 ABC transporter ATP-binding protein [Actinomycetota bacterium]NIU18924.1 ABC transporter ATP-binding protein [Actinomycetota bacterium]NIU65943.1 ABC transporter ATP-binding protein [Actinomycetota bacterium]
MTRPASDQLAISTRAMSRSFDGRVAVDSLDLDVNHGEVLALLGPNGAGKTTTVRLLNGVLRPDRGHAAVLGLDPVTQGDDVRRRTGVLTENAGLDDRLTARENLEYAARMRGFERNDARRRVAEQLDRFAMADMADLPTAGFSTGQRKRVALARALLHDPDVLFLDEPTSGLDPAATREVTDLIGTLAREHGRTIVLATHFLGEAGRVADRMAVLDHGRLRAIGRPDDLAAELWDGVPADIDLGGPATGAQLELVSMIDGVLRQEPRATGMTISVRDRAAMASVLRTLTGHGVDVYGATVRRASMEDVYFALESVFAAERTG